MTIDVAAWYEKYGPMVIRRCRKILGNGDDAMDAVHDVFVNLLQSKPKLHGTFPSSLLYTMATNICLNRIRKNKREVIFDFSGENENMFSSGDTSYDGGFNQVDAEIMTDAVLKDESESNRVIYYMYFADGMTLKEIGEAVGLSISGVRKRLEAFKKRTRLKMQVEGGDYGKQGL